MLEAMGAGLPIVASRLPAHSDLLQNGTLGCIVDSRNALVCALDDLVEPNANHALGSSAKAWVKQEIGSWEDAALRYQKAYQDLVFGNYRS